jgi:hypothetical protein
VAVQDPRAFPLTHSFGCIGAWTRWEYHGLVAIGENPVMDMGVYCPCQNLAFDVSAERNEIICRLCVGDPGDVLFDDRAFIQIFGNIMGGRPNELHAPLEGLLVGSHP